MSNWTRLHYLYMSGKDLTGTIPSDIGAYSNLLELLADDNRLSGMLPSELGVLTLLQTLNLAGNNFTDSVPEEMEFLESNGSLAVLNLTGNPLLSGPLADDICAVDELDFDCGDLCGCDSCPCLAV